MKKRTRTVLWTLGIIGVLAVSWWGGLPHKIGQALEAIRGMGPWAPVCYFFLYIVSCILLIPGSILTLGAGAIFGVVWGSVYASLAASVGATAAFLIGRYLARDWVVKKIQSNPRFKTIDEAVGREGWRIVGLSRLSPLFPFVLLNYMFGVTKVTLREYFFASWIGMIPGTVLYVYLGALAGDLARVGAGDRARSPMEWTLMGVGLIATLLVTLRVTKIASKALKEKT